MKIIATIAKVFSHPHKFKFILVFVLFFSVVMLSCRKDRLEQYPENQFSYVPPDYPEKPAGRYLKSIYLEDPGMGISGTKVEFIYDEKKYIKSYLFREYDHTDIAGYVLPEYDIDGNAIRVKLLAPDSSLLQYDDVEYDLQRRFTKISTFKPGDENENFELSVFSEFIYPSIDSIIEYHYIRYYNFEMPTKNVFLRDSSGNVCEVLRFRFEGQYPYSSRENYFTDKYRIIDRQGIPKYYMSLHGINVEQILSSNTINGFQSFTYEDGGLKVPFGEPTYLIFEHDDDGYPHSQGNLYYYYYEYFD